MEVRDLRIFLAVVEEGSFAAAGRRLGFARSTVTERIAMLERLVGAPLLQRGPVCLSPAGLRFDPYARRIVEQVDGAFRAVSATTDRARASLRIGLMASGAAEMNPPLFAALHRALPGARFSLVELPLPTLEDSVADGTVDVAILRSPVGNPQLEVVQLFLAGRVAILSKSSPLSAAESLTVEDLTDMPMTGTNEAMSRAFIDFFLLREQRNGEPPARILQAYSLPEAMLHVLTLGAVATPSSEAVRVFPTPGAVAVPLLGVPASGPVAVCRRSDSRYSVRAFMAIAGHIAETCQGLVPDRVEAISRSELPNGTHTAAAADA